MPPYAQLTDAVKEASVERNGRLTLACPAAFQLAERLAVEVSAIGAVCVRESIKIVQCQLGCF